MSLRRPMGHTQAQTPLVIVLCLSWLKATCFLFLMAHSFSDRPPRKYCKGCELGLWQKGSELGLWSPISTFPDSSLFGSKTLPLKTILVVKVSISRQLLDSQVALLCATMWASPPPDHRNQGEQRDHEQPVMHKEMMAELLRLSSPDRAWMLPNLAPNQQHLKGPGLYLQRHFHNRSSFAEGHLAPLGGLRVKSAKFYLQAPNSFYFTQCYKRGAPFCHSFQLIRFPRSSHLICMELQLIAPSRKQSTQAELIKRC